MAKAHLIGNPTVLELPTGCNSTTMTVRQLYAYIHRFLSPLLVPSVSARESEHVSAASEPLHPISEKLPTSEPERATESKSSYSACVESTAVAPEQYPFSLHYVDSKGEACSRCTRRRIRAPANSTGNELSLNLESFVPPSLSATSSFKSTCSLSSSWKWSSPFCSGCVLLLNDQPLQVKCTPITTTFHVFCLKLRTCESIAVAWAPSVWRSRLSFRRAEEVVELAIR